MAVNRIRMSVFSRSRYRRLQRFRYTQVREIFYFVLGAGKDIGYAQIQCCSPFMVQKVHHTTVRVITLPPRMPTTLTKAKSNTGPDS